MEKHYSKPEVETIANKAFLDGKVKSLDYFISYINSLIEPSEEHHKYILENNWTISENFFRLDEKIQILNEVKAHFEKTLIDLKTRKK